MRTYGRVPQPDGTLQWQIVETDASGNDDAVWLTTMAQCVLLNLNESPMFGDWGIPQSVTMITRVLPDYYIQRLQQRLSPYFASLSITRRSGTATYNAGVLLHNGASVSETIAL